jgi:hypothetical protein
VCHTTTNIVYKGPKTRILHQVTLALTYPRGLNSTLLRISDHGDLKVRTLLTPGKDQLAHFRQQCATTKIHHALFPHANLSNEALARWLTLQEAEAPHSLQHPLIHIIFPERQVETNWRWPRVYVCSTKPTNTTGRGPRHLRKNNSLCLARKTNDLKYITPSRMRYPSRRDRHHQQLQHLYRCPT